MLLNIFLGSLPIMLLYIYLALIYFAGIYLSYIYLFVYLFVYLSCRTFILSNISSDSRQITIPCEISRQCAKLYHECRDSL